MFGKPVGTCDWCGTNGLALYEYNGKDVCAACRQILRDYDRADIIDEKYQQLHNLIEHADTNYPYP